MILLKKIVPFTLCTLLFLNTKAQTTFKEPVNFKLKNGMTVLVSENDKSANTFASFTLNETDFTSKKDGIIELTNGVINESVDANIQARFNDNSGKLSTSATNFEQDLAKFSQLIQDAKINQQTFDAAKSKLLASLKSHSYDYDQTVNEKSIQALTLNDVQEFYAQITPEKAFLTVVGNISANAVKNSTKKTFGNWVVSKETSNTLTK
ncbi:hypothetical protein [Pedobacter sp. MW01-1-1]|uniref:hypothetical protein n=1 Tax=Pedobacter sp. MW01-1-1 TaxID=3383027 RepID=UPI003FEEC763